MPIPDQVLIDAFRGYCGIFGGGQLSGDPAKPIRCNPGALTLDQAHMVGLWLEGLLFGFFAALVGVCLWILLRRNRPFSMVSWAMLLTTLTMFALSLAHISVSLFRNLETSFGDIPSVLLVGFSDPGFLSKAVIYLMQTAISDAFLVYRCWIIWNKRWKVAIGPALLIAAGLAVGIALVSGLKNPKSPTSTEFDPEYVVLFTTYLSLTLVANASATGAIAYRIWKVRRTLAGTMSASTSSAGSTGPLGGKDLLTVVVILLESGSIYFVTLVALFASYLAKSNSHFIVFDCVPPVIGIVFTLIIIRVGMGTSKSERQTTQPPYPVSPAAESKLFSPLQKTMTAGSMSFKSSSSLLSTPVLVIGRSGDPSDLNPVRREDTESRV